MISPQQQPFLQQENFYKTLLDSLFDAVYTVDQDRVVTYWNQSCTRLTGYVAQEIVGQKLDNIQFIYSDERNQLPEKRPSRTKITLETGMPGSCKGYIRRKNGQRVPILSHISVLRDENGEIYGAVEVFRDISAQVALEDAHRQVLMMSRKDQLTQLYNRLAINELLNAEINRSRRYSQPLSVIMLDIDHFKNVNDQYGHDVGDKVLAKVGSILSHNLRIPDVVGRWGGEEFLIIAPGSDKQAGMHLAERIRCLIEKIDLSEIEESITASFGVGGLIDQQDRDQLVNVADMALYQAKEAGRNCVVVGSENTANSPAKSTNN